jgi:hypothetical protein
MIQRRFSACSEDPPALWDSSSAHTTFSISSLCRTFSQGLTLVHFSAQSEPFPTQNTPETPPDTPGHPLNTP